MVLYSVGFVLANAFVHPQTTDSSYNPSVRSIGIGNVLTQNERRLRPNLSLSMEAEHGNDIDKEEKIEMSNESSSSDNIKIDTSNDKPKSRLAMLAEDWMAEEEEDELADYWGRFEDNKLNQKSIKVEAKKDEIENLPLTTEERLERYFDRRGINKQKEKKHATQIQEAIEKATNILESGRPPQQAIQALQTVRPYLQANTRLGGTALIQLAVALWQNDEQEEALLLCEELKQNRHVRSQVIKFMENGPSSLKGMQQQTYSFWKGTIFDRDLTSWWD